MNISYRYLNSFNEVGTYINIYFDEYLWGDLCYENIYESYVKTGCKIVLFESDEKPIALLIFKVNDSENSLEKVKGKYEIIIFEVSEKTCGTNKGVGTKVINYFKENIASDRDICGYSVAESACFWKKVSTEVDEEVYCELEKHNFDHPMMMYFNIS